MQLFDFEKTNAPTTYRNRALQEYGAFCNWCGYAKDVAMLDVDHIDENRKNNEIENLQVLCVWCHATKTRKVKWHRWDSPAEEKAEQVVSQTLKRRESFESQAAARMKLLEETHGSKE